MNIILVRHGQTDWNLKNKLQGSTNIDLNETGVLQAKQTAKNLANKNIDVIYSSPLNRTLATTNEINKNRNIKVIKDDRLIERGFGNLEGLEGKKVNFKKYWDFSLNACDENIESMSTFFNRIYNFLNDIFIKYKDTPKTILLVTHNGVNLAISSILEGAKKNIFEYNLKTCDYKLFENLTILPKLEDIWKI